MAVSPARFTFDLDLAPAPAPQGGLSDAAIAALIEDARQAGHAEGVSQGQHGAVAKAAQAQRAAADRLAQTAAQLLATADDQRAELVADAVELAVTVARKLCPALLARQPQAELMALIEESLSTLNRVPHLVVRCHPDLAPGLEASAGAALGAAGFTGRLVVMPDPDRALGDGRIEWADGGLERDLHQVHYAIDTLIADYLAARMPGAATETHS